MLSYWFYPNPGNVHYSSPKVLVIFGVCLVLLIASWGVSAWRRKQSGQTKKLSRSWPSAMRWFAIIGLVLTVSRVEHIQFLAMRFLWVVWGAAILIFIGFQVFIWKRKHYSVVKGEGSVEDPRAKYLPK